VDKSVGKLGMFRIFAIKTKRVVVALKKQAESHTFD
jgi:hypothetical protein